jgi:hypothetical protein
MHRIRTRTWSKISANRSGALPGLIEILYLHKWRVHLLETYTTSHFQEYVMPSLNRSRQIMLQVSRHIR